MWAGTTLGLEMKVAVIVYCGGAWISIPANFSIPCITTLFFIHDDIVTSSFLYPLHKPSMF